MVEVNGAIIRLQDEDGKVSWWARINMSPDKETGSTSEYATKTYKKMKDAIAEANAAAKGLKWKVMGYAKRCYAI